MQGVKNKHKKFQQRIKVWKFWVLLFERNKQSSRFVLISNESDFLPQTEKYSCLLLCNPLKLTLFNSIYNVAKHC